MIKIKDIKLPRYGFGIAFADPHIYVIGGCLELDTKCTKKCERYNIYKDEWTDFVDLPNELLNPSAVVFDSRYLYLIGGFCESLVRK